MFDDDLAMALLNPTKPSAWALDPLNEVVETYEQDLLPENKQKLYRKKRSFSFKGEKNDKPTRSKKTKTSTAVSSETSDSYFNEELETSQRVESDDEIMEEPVVKVPKKRGRKKSANNKSFEESFSRFNEVLESAMKMNVFSSQSPMDHFMKAVVLDIEKQPIDGDLISEFKSKVLDLTHNIINQQLERDNKL